MDLLNLYYYTNGPLITGNMIYYCLTSISTSITSSQNVLHFINDHIHYDSTVFLDEMVTLDIENKLIIIESFIFNILKNYCKDNNEFTNLKNSIKNPTFLNTINDNTLDFTIIEFTNENNLLNQLDEPIKISIISTYQILEQINNTISKVNEKIIKYKNSYFKLSTLCLKKEIHKLKQQMNILDIRFNLLLEFVKIYLPANKN